MRNNTIEKPKTIREIVGVWFVGFITTHAILLTDNSVQLSGLLRTGLSSFAMQEILTSSGGSLLSENIQKMWSACNARKEFILGKDLINKLACRMLFLDESFFEKTLSKFLSEFIYFYVKHVGFHRTFEKMKDECVSIVKNFNAVTQLNISKEDAQALLLLSLTEHAIEDFERNTTYAAARDFREVRDRDGVSYYPGYCASLFQVATNFSDASTRTMVSILKGILAADHLTSSEKVVFIFKEINDKTGRLNKHLQDAFIRHYVLVPRKKEQAQEQDNVVDVLESSINSPVKA